MLILFKVTIKQMLNANSVQHQTNSSGSLYVPVGRYSWGGWDCPGHSKLYKMNPIVNFNVSTCGLSVWVGGLEATFNIVLLTYSRLTVDSICLNTNIKFQHLSKHQIVVYSVVEC